MKKLIYILAGSILAFSANSCNKGKLAQPAAGNGWRIIGPGGGGGQFRPTISPHDPDRVLVACDMTGAYITYNGGKSWREFNLRSRVDAFAFDPTAPDVIYAGSTGLYRSEDRGKKWRLIFPDPASGVKERMVGDHANHSFVSGDNWPGGMIKAIAVDPDQPDHLFIAIDSGGLRLFYSTDRGRSWREGCRLAGRKLHCLYLDPTSPRNDRRLYLFTESKIHRLSAKSLTPKEIPQPPGVNSITHAAAGIDQLSGKPVFYLTAPARWINGKLAGGVFRSTDRGESWDQVTGGIEGELAGPGKGTTPEFTLLACSSNHAGTAYLTAKRFPQIDPNTGSVANSYGILKTTDGGWNWKWVLRVTGNANPHNKKVGWLGRNYGPGWCEAPLGLGVGPSNPEVCYATDYGSTYKTTDGGQTWEQVYSNDHPDGSVSTRGLDVTTCYGVHFDPFDKDHIVISYTDIGLFHSKNGGRSWYQTIKGVPNPWINTCYWLVFDPDVKGRAWSVWANCHDLPRPKMFRRGNFDRYLGGVCRTDDGLENWRKSNKGMPENCVTTHIVLDPKSPPGNRTLYVAGFGKGVFKSVDDGRTWTRKAKGISGNLNAWRLVLTPSGTLYLLVARGLKEGRVIDGSVYRSDDGAEHWEPVSLSTGINAPNDMVYDPSEPSRLYLACWPRTVNGVERDGGLLVSEDGGKTWRRLFDESAHVYSVAVDPGNTATLFINTFDSAAYRSDDRGKTWHRLRGYNFKWGHRPVLDPHYRGMLYLTTFGSSVWYGPTTGVPGAFEDIYPFK